MELNNKDDKTFSDEQVIIKKEVELGNHKIPYTIVVNKNDLPKDAEDFYLDFLLKTI